MSFLTYLNSLDGPSWLDNISVINTKLRTAPEVSFKFYPAGKVVHGKPRIVDKKLSEVVFFWQEKCKRITLVDYIKEKYGYTIRNPHHNGIVIDGKNGKIFPPELLYFHTLDGYKAFNYADLE